MRLFVVGVLALVTLAGCAETPADVNDAFVDPGADDSGANAGDGAKDGSTNTPADGAVAGLTGTLVAGVDNATVSAGTPFNVTLDYTGDNATNASTLFWQVAFTNETGDQVSYNGTGLPAVFEANLTLLGNVTLTGNATNGDAGVVFEPLFLIVSVAEIADVDPCLGIGPQDPVTIKGSNLAPAGGTDHAMEVLPCQTKLSASISMAGGSVDNDWWLFDPSGAQRGSGTSFGIRTENGINVSDANGLAAGNWKFTVENFLGAAADYTITVTFE